MNEDVEKVILKNPDGDTAEVFVLAELEYNGNSYVAYTYDLEDDSEDDVSMCIGKYENDVLIEIDDDKEYENVFNVIQSIAEGDD